MTTPRSVRILAALAASSAIVGCSWGDEQDPGAGFSPTSVTNVLQLPDGGTLAHLGHVVSDGTTLYAFATLSGSEPVRRLIQRDGDGTWSALWETLPASVSGPGGEPRILVGGDAVYWIAGDALMSRKKAGTSAPAQVCGSAGQKPGGMAILGHRVYWIQADGCGYSYDGTGQNQGRACAVSTPWDSLLACDLGAAAQPVPAAATQLQARSVIANTMPDALLSDGTSLYWFEGKTASSAAWPGASLVRWSASDAGLQDPVSILELDAGAYPMAMKAHAGELYLALARPDPAGNLSGCTIQKLPKAGGTPQTLAESPSRMCFGLSLDGTDTWFAARWKEGEDSSWREGIGRLRSGATELPPVLLLDRAGLGLRSVLAAGDAAYGSGSGLLLRVPKSLVP